MRECMKKKSMLWMLAVAILLGTLVFGSTKVQAAGPGWQQENGAWYYYDDATTKHIGWLDEGGHRYYLKGNENGAMATGWIQIEGLYYYFDPNGYLCTGWYYDGNDYYFLNPGGANGRDDLPLGAMLTGWRKVDGIYYYFHATGEMATGWQLTDGQWWYLNQNGQWLGYEYDQEAKNKIFGVDVSKYQGDVDWAALRSAGVDFTFIRIGHGSRSLDTYYKQNMQGANAAGIAAGVYFYSTAQNVAQAVGDAQFVIDNLRGYNVSYPVAIDLEDKSQSNLTQQQITDIAVAFCDEIRAAGYTPMIYCNEYWAKNRIDFSRLPNVERWIARYNYTWDKSIDRGVWQAGSTTVLPGISGVGVVDIDFAYKNYRTIVTPRTAADPNYTKRTGTWVSDARGWWYAYFAGGYPVNKWEHIGGKWYYFDASGYAVTSGWQYINGIWYFMDRDGAMITGWVYYNGNWYYMNPSGAMATGWVWDGYNWYYMDANGAMVNGGWHMIGGTWYYMNAGGAMATGWIWDGANWYYMKDSGAMATGWVWDGYNWYYMNPSGAMATGWVWDGYNWYYMNSSGAMTTGWQLVNGTWYYMYDSGAMASNTWIGNYHVNASGAWDR